MKAVVRKQRAATSPAWLNCICGLALAMFAASSTVAAAGGTDLTRRNETLQITLREYNYAHVRPALLKQSEAVASTIFAEAGVTIRWATCPFSEAEIGHYTDCPEPTGFSDFSLRILPRAMADAMPSHGDALGSAPECPAGTRNCFAYVYPSRVASLAAVEGVWEYQLLGNVMAHEVGHLLLGASSHAETGIMRASWQAEDFRGLITGYLLFNSEEGERIRTEVRSRAAQNPALAAGESALTASGQDARHHPARVRLSHLASRSARKR